jgi:SAM-dependent methyltransferase
MRITYGHIDDAYRGYSAQLSTLLDTIKPLRVIEIGGGATPALGLKEISHRRISEYSILDISKSELAKAPAGYTKVIGDICALRTNISGGYDFAFSRFLAEHVPDGRRFHQNIFALLNPGGVAFHFFPTMFCCAYAANMVIPEKLGQKILTLLDKNRTQEGHAAKFPARYHWCRGPIESSISRLESIGYEVDQYSGFFGHYYYSKFPGLWQLHQAKTSYLMRHPNPRFTSLAYLVLRKPQIS